MRLLIKAERSFVSSLIDDTRRVVEGPRPPFEKVAILQFKAARHAHKLDRIRARMDGAEHDTDRFAKLERLLEARWKALGYLRATARFLSRQERHPNGLIERPRYFASAWNPAPASADPWPESKEWPFMEYSS